MSIDADTFDMTLPYFDADDQTIKYHGLRCAAVKAGTGGQASYMYLALFAYITQLWVERFVPPVRATELYPATLEGTVTVNMEGFKGISAAFIDIIEIGPGIDSEPGDPSIVYAGKYAWGTKPADAVAPYHGDMKFLNFRHMIVTPEFPAPPLLTLWLKPGVKALVTLMTDTPPDYFFKNSPSFAVALNPLDRDFALPSQP